jgi:hypothetical protein
MTNQEKLQRISVGDGWKPLVEDLDRELSQIVPGYEILQVKQKLGGLRYYVAYPEKASSQARSAADAAILAAERKASQTCETCGQPGRLRAGPGIRTTCDEHAPA